MIRYEDCSPKKYRLDNVTYYPLVSLRDYWARYGHGPSKYGTWRLEALRLRELLRSESGKKCGICAHVRHGTMGVDERGNHWRSPDATGVDKPGAEVFLWCPLYACGTSDVTGDFGCNRWEPRP